MMKVSTFNHYLDRTPLEYDLTFRQLCLALVHVRTEANKKKQKTWSPSRFDGTRSKDNAREISCLVYDCDDGLENPDAAFKKIVDAGYALSLIHISEPTRPY